jgi:DNA-binding Lrp family transcriptional regulator
MRAFLLRLLKLSGVLIMYDLLTLLQNNARLSNEEMAAMLKITPAEVEKKIKELEKKGIIRGYKAVIDWDKTDREFAAAEIELKVTPTKGKGFDEIAQIIADFPEVYSLRLMSGGYDLALTVVGKSFKEVANFVAFKLAPLDGVQSTATHITLCKYKENGVVLEKTKDERIDVL